MPLRLFAVIFLLLSSGRVSAQLRNADFEDWAGPSLHPHPIGWQHDGGTDTNGGFGTARTDTAEHGNYALQLYRWYSYVWDWVSQTAPVSTRPTMIHGYYRYTDNILQSSNPLDTAIIWVSVTRWNSASSKNDTIGYANIELGASDTFTPFTGVIQYSSSSIPDSLSIKISPTLGYSGSSARGNTGSYLTIDNLSLETEPATPQQTFITIGTDKSGDVLQPFANDMKSLSYAIDKAHDSLWFRIGTYDIIQGDLGFAIGLDTDNNITNGHAWGGANHSMKYDLVVFIERDIVLPTMIFGGVETGPSHPTTAHFAPSVVDPHTVEVNLKLSEITSRGLLHIVAGSGAFDIESNGDVYDDLPDKTYITLDLQADVAASAGPPNSTIAVYPNPCADRITIDRPDASLLRVTDAVGREVNVPSTQTSQGLELSTRRLPDGIYLLTYRSSGTTHTDKFAIRK
jgi:hypothetical protein